jgi:hypothetical protein
MAAGKAFGYNDLKTVRGAAAAFLEQGAERVYLSNYMDSQTAIEDLAEYPPMLRECGRLETLAGKARRHVLTYTDTWAPGEAQSYLLPATIEPGQWRTFRIATGPADPRLKARVRLGVDRDASTWTVYTNALRCAFAGVDKPEAAWPETPVYAFEMPQRAERPGETVIEVKAGARGTVHWVEIAKLPS